MKKLFALLGRAPRLTGALAIVAAVVAVSAATYAWGPDRPDIDAKKGADYVVFNSMTNNPNYGNERQFITVQDPKTGNYGNNVTVEPGKEYMVRVLVHNDANTKAHPTKDLRAINTTLRTVVSPKTGKTNAITAYVDADNATPKSVYADIAFNSDQDFNLAYVTGSARAYNNGYAAGGDGKPLNDSMVTQAGVKLGYAKEGDGVIPGCFEYINYVYFKVRPQFAPSTDFTVQKKVSEADKNKWNETLATTPGQTIDYRIEYKNTGGIVNNDVVVKDTLPQGVSYVPGSTMLYNNKLPQGKQLSDNITTKDGVNIGHYAPGANAFVVFKAKVAANDALAVCDINTLINKATVETDYGKKTDDATITVTKKCEEPPVKIQVCDLTTKKVITINEKDFDGKKHSKNLDDCKPPVMIQVCELTTKKIITINEKDFDGKKHSKDLNDCKEVVVKIQVCELATKKIITIDEKNFDNKKHSKDLKDCEVVNKIQVCELDTKKVITINEKDFDAKKHSKDLNDCKPPVMIKVCELETKKIISIDEKDFDGDKHSKDLNDCKEVPPVTPPVTEKCDIPGKEHLDKDSADCVQTPVTELPTTGMGDIMPILGAGSLIAAASYYVASRRSLL